jgi:hypothetical protein
VAEIYFQACSFNHSDISPFRINDLRTLSRVKNDLGPDCALTLSATPHILTVDRRSPRGFRHACESLPSSVSGRLVGKAIERIHGLSRSH